MSVPSPTRDKILTLLRDTGPMTAAELSDALGMRRQQVDCAIRKTRAHKGFMHITGWKRSLGTRGAMGAIWAAGPGRDAKQPEPLTKAQTNASYYQKHKAVIRLKARATYGTAPAGALGYMAIALGARP